MLLSVRVSHKEEVYDEDSLEIRVAKRYTRQWISLPHYVHPVASALGV